MSSFKLITTGMEDRRWRWQLIWNFCTIRKVRFSVNNKSAHILYFWRLIKTQTRLLSIKSFPCVYRSCLVPYVPLSVRVQSEESLVGLTGDSQLSVCIHVWCFTQRNPDRRFITVLTEPHKLLLYFLDLTPTAGEIFSPNVSTLKLTLINILSCSC